MAETIPTFLSYGFLAVIAIAVINAFVPTSRLHKDKELYFEFCRIRRDLMNLVYENKVNPKSLAFEFFMRFLSDVIHYSEDARFGTKQFIRGMKRDSHDLAKIVFLRKLMADAERQSPEFQAIKERTFVVMIRAFRKNYVVCLMLSFSGFFKLIESRKPDSGYTYAAQAVRIIRANPTLQYAT